MNSTVCDFSFNLAGWQIVTNKSLSDEDWLLGEPHWYQQAANWEAFSPKLAFLPPLKRRRLSSLARLFFESAWDLVGEQADMPVVYASSNSEINRNFALWQSLLQEGDVSPTSFSLSVHNALIGQWSELRQVKAETTSIMACGDNLETALLEAYLLLQEGNEKVLIVVAEDPLEEMYNVVPFKRPPFGYALALVIEQGSQYQLVLSAQTKSPQTDGQSQDNALQFVRVHKQADLQNTAENQPLVWQTNSNTGGSWLWRKN